MKLCPVVSGTIIRPALHRLLTYCKFFLSILFYSRYNELRDPAYQSKLDISNFTVIQITARHVIF